MNILQLQDNLKNFSEDQLVREMQMPSGQVPQFLVLSELGRRKRVKEDFTRQQAANQPTVAQETVAAAGVPQSGATDMARAMAPKTSTTENTGIGALMPKQPTRMADGGVVKMATAGSVPEQDQKAALIAALKRTGGDYDRDMYVRVFGEDAVREAESAIFNQGLAGGVGLATQARMEKQGIFGIPKMTTEEAMAARRAIAGTPDPESTYEKGTGRATMVDGTVVEVMPDGRVYNVATGKEVSESVAAKAIEKLTPDIAADNAAKEAAKVPTLYDTSIGMPSQEQLDREYAAELLGIPANKQAENAAKNTGQDRTVVDLTTDTPTILSSPTAPSLADVLGGAPQISAPDVTQRDYGETNLVAPEVYPSVPDTVSYSEAGLDPIQVKINQLKGIIESDAPIEEKSRAATELQRFQEDLAINLYGGNIGVTAEGQGAPIPEGMVMTGMGLQRDPNYQAPGKTGISIVDQAANQGTEALTELGKSGVVPQDVIDKAMPAATLSDFEKDIFPLNKDIMDVQEALGNPYLSSEDQAAAEQRINELNKEKEDLAVERGVSTMFTPPAVEAAPTMGGFEGLIDVTAPAKPDPLAVKGVPSGFSLGTVDDKIPAESQELSFGKTVEDAKEKAEAKKKTEAAAAAKSASSTTGGGGGAGGKGAGAAGGLEGQLAQMLKDMEKSREQDKWLAIAQIGAEMMKPTATFGEGIGNAISKGADAMREGKKQYSQDKLTIMALQQKIDAAKLAASSRGSGSTKIPPATLLTAAQSEVTRLTTALQNATTPAERLTLSEALDTATAQRDALFSGITSYYPGLNLPSGPTGSGRTQVN